MQDISKIFDGLLVLQYRGGDRKALDLIVKRYHSRLCAHAFWYTRDAEASKDIVQDSWSNILMKIGTLKDPNKFGSWAMTIVTRKSLDYLGAVKKERSQKENLSWEVPSQDKDQSAKGDTIKLLKTAIKGLSEEHQLVLRLFYLEGYTLIEIGHIIGLSVGTVKSRLFHAREKLKSILK